MQQRLEFVPSVLKSKVSTTGPIFGIDQANLGGMVVVQVGVSSSSWLLVLSKGDLSCCILYMWMMSWNENNVPYINTNCSSILIPNHSHFSRQTPIGSISCRGPDAFFTTHINFYQTKQDIYHSVKVLPSNVVFASDGTKLAWLYSKRRTSIARNGYDPKTSEMKRANQTFVLG